MKTELQMRIALKSRVPLPHLKQTKIIEDGIFNVGGFSITLDDKEAFLDWDNSMIRVGFNKEDYLVLMVNMYGELDEETYMELNEDIENIIPFEEIYKIETLMKSTFQEISYEAYEKDYDGDIIPMDVKLINFAKVSNSKSEVLEDANYSDEKLDAYNEREDVKWRLEGVRDPKTIHSTTGVYSSCLA